MNIRLSYLFVFTLFSNTATFINKVYAPVDSSSPFIHLIYTDDRSNKYIGAATFFYKAQNYTAHLDPAHLEEFKLIRPADPEWYEGCICFEGEDAKMIYDKLKEKHRQQPGC